MWNKSLSAARFFAAAAAAAISKGRPPPAPSVAEAPPVAFEVDNPAAAAATTAAAAAEPLVEVCKCAAGLREATAAAIEAINEQPPTFEEPDAADDGAVCASSTTCVYLFKRCNLSLCACVKVIW